MSLSSKEALMLLKSGVINTNNDLLLDKNKWILHCISVGDSARIIAEALGCDADYAAALGYIHDIGRKISHKDHVTEGYQYMLYLGYSEEASICLTHSFINNDIHLVADGDLEEGELKEFFKSFFAKRKITIYDNIIQLCDLMCLPSGITTLEKRLLDIYTRKGIHDNILDHYQNALALKEKIETMLGHSLYSLFPDIDINDLESINDDAEAINRLINAHKENILKKENNSLN